MLLSIYQCLLFALNLAGLASCLPTGNSRASTSKNVVAYYPSWKSRQGHAPSDIKAIGSLTHVIFAFAGIDATGSISLADPTNDQQSLRDLVGLKAQNPSLKVLLSVGGWTYSNEPTAEEPKNKNVFKNILDPAKLGNFVTSAVGLVNQYQLDGLDIDWEYPTGGQAQTLANMLAQIKQAAPSKILTVATSAGLSKIQDLRLEEMNQHVDMFHVMAFDFVTGSSGTTGHASNLYSTGSSKDSGDSAVTAYIGRGIPSNKINLGIPLYGRVMSNTAGVGSPFSPPMPQGVKTEERTTTVGGQALAALNSEPVQWDDTAKASYLLNSAQMYMVSFDDKKAIQAKASYVQQKSLGGAMFWNTFDDAQGLMAVFKNSW